MLPYIVSTGSLSTSTGTEFGNRCPAFSVTNKATTTPAWQEKPSIVDLLTVRSGVARASVEAQLLAWNFGEAR